ncbi:MAG: Rid family detoxifying hydrolase [Candidatus Bathyarchaeum tardum]|nr:MAG: Rid family detoxifying hydrolase [Candidatus Bathyarchaeum tardum]
MLAETAPKPVGPYSQAIFSDNLIFVSGQIPIDPKTTKIVKGAIETQTIQVLENIKLILESVHLSMGDVIKTSVFLSDFADFRSFNAVYSRYFEQNPPARTTVQVGLMPEVLVEIDAIAKKS